MDFDAKKDPSESEEVLHDGRRQLLKAIGAGAGYVAVRLALPAAWSTPVVASLVLPAHAQASSGLACVAETPPTGSVQDNTATITPTVTAGQVSLVIKPPAGLLSGRKPFVLCELTGTTNSVASTVIPSADAALSGQITQSFSRAKGTYKYQTRWEDGHSAWVTVVVP